MGMMQLLNATTTGGAESAVAAVDVPSDGHIIGIDWSVRSDLDADAEFCELQLSFGSVRTTGNDARQVLSNVQAQAYLLTSGYGVTSIQKWIGPIRVQVFAGERIYLHSNATAGVVSVVLVTLFYDFDIGRPSSRRT
jgi:hypothetical protein